MLGTRSTGGLMEAAQELTAELEHVHTVGIQAGAYLLELSLDWIVLRTSENIHRLLGESHVTVVDEPLGRFVHSQALHDLRNLFSRLSATTGIARAYGIRLTDDPDLVDVSFQLSDGRVLLEAVPSAGSSRPAKLRRVFRWGERTDRGSRGKQRSGIARQWCAADARTHRLRSRHFRMR